MSAIISPEELDQRDKHGFPLKIWYCKCGAIMEDSEGLRHARDRDQNGCGPLDMILYERSGDPADR